MAQDFKAAFGLGKGDTTINSGNEMGVALAAIKGAYQELQDRDAKIAALQAENSALQIELETRLATIEKRLDETPNQAASRLTHFARISQSGE